MNSKVIRKRTIVVLIIWVLQMPDITEKKECCFLWLGLILNKETPVAAIIEVLDKERHDELDFRQLEGIGEYKEQL